MELTIHYVGWAGQPYVQLYCTEEMHYVWGPPPGMVLPENVYVCDTNTKPLDVIPYTFEKKLVNCSACLEKLNHG